METDSTTNTYGYARVSTDDQNEDRQLVALRAAGVTSENIFTDHKSGKDFNRPAWKKLVRKLKPGDLLVVSSIDRFGRNYEEVLSEWRRLVKTRQVHVRVLDMPLLDTTTAQGLLAVFIGNIVLQILSFVAETERQQIKSRQSEGIAAARRRGVKFGRPKAVLPPRFAAAKDSFLTQTQPLRAAASSCGMPPTTFWRKCHLSN